MNQPQKTLTDRTFAASIWVIGGKLVAKSVDFVTLIILARLLSPADFGLVGMAMTVVLMAEAVLELPVVQALVRIKNPTQSMFDTAFTLSILRGIALAILLSVVAWPISEFYHEPRLLLLICVLSLAPMLRGALSPGMVVFIREMDFRRDFLLDCTGKFIALILSSCIALKTGSYWAIAVGTIATPLTMNVLSYGFAPHTPRFSLSQWSRFSEIVVWNSASAFITAINWQFDRLLLGRFVSEAEFGRFTLANDLTGIPIQALVSPIARPLLAAFAPLAQSSSLGGAYCRASNAVFMIASPVLVGMGLLAEPAIRLVLGQHWSEAAPFLHWLALITVVGLPVSPMPSLAMVMNRTKMIAIRSIIELLIKLPITVTAIIEFGVWGAIAARAILSVVMLAVSMGAVRKLTGVSLYFQIKAVWRTLVALGAMTFCVLLLGPSPDPSGENILRIALSTTIASISGALVYIFTLIVLWWMCGCPAGIEKTAIQAIESFIAWLRRFLSV